ncbi:MAG: nuclear transport factor 2 family protein [Saonia sp.]
MNISQKEIAIAFSNGEFEKTYPFLSKDIVWEIVGENTFKGKENVITNCKQTTEYFNSVETIFNTEDVVTSSDRMIVRGTAEFKKEGKRVNFIKACDVYEFDDEDKIVNIYSYCIQEQSK